MKILSAISVAAATVATMAAVHAADLKMPVKAPPPIAATSTGFYIVGGGNIMFDGRGDANFDGNCGDPARLAPCGVNSRVDTRNGFGGFAGVGYRFLPWLRGELRLGGGTVDGKVSTDPMPPTYVGFHTVAANVDTIVGQANAYIDFAGFLPAGTLGAFEPYIGAGAGAGRVRISNVVETSTARPAGDLLLHPGGETTNFVWNAGIGTAVRLSAFGLPRGLLLDVGYRYDDYGTVRTNSGTLVLSTPGGGLTPLKFQNGFSGHGQGHGVEIALRYEFN